MGRPRQHGAETADALLDAAERIAETEGLDALTVRRVADAAGASTRAVYSVFGSKDGLVVALGVRAFDLLRVEILELPTSNDPAADLVEAGVTVFRRLMVERPALFRIGVQREFPEPELAAGFRDAATAALAGLDVQVARLETAGLLGGRTVPQARRAFHAMCEGLATMELRRMLPVGDEERAWRDALEAVVRGLGTSPTRTRSAAARRPSRPARGRRAR